MSGGDPFHPSSFILHPYWTLLLNGVLFGLGAAVPIGPVNVEIARRALRGGVWGGGGLGCGAGTPGVGYTLLYSIGVGPVTDQPVGFLTPPRGGGAALRFFW